MTRKQKRGTIIAIYAAIVIGFIGLILISRDPVYTCFDNTRNQNETGVDCGGICAACVVEINAKDVIVENIDIVFGGQDRYDVLATVRNPNVLYGAANVSYEMVLIDAAGGEIATVKDTGFILPPQEKYFAMLNVPSTVAPAEATLRITDVNWVEFTGFEDPDFIVQNLTFGKVQNSTNYAELFGLVRNNSPFDFLEVTVLAILMDERGEPIAVNQSVLGAFDAGEARDVPLSWPFKFPGEIANGDIEVYADVFDSQNFVQKYLPGGRFERFE